MRLKFLKKRQISVSSNLCLEIINHPMKFKFIAILTCFVSITAIAQNKTKSQVKPTTKPKLTVSLTKVPTQEFTNQVDSVSYAVGVLVAQNFKSQKVILNPAMVAKGFAAATQGATLKMTEQECQNAVQNYMMKNQEAQALEQSKQFLPNKEAGEKFLAENKMKDSVFVTESGLQYKIIKLGTGPKPLITDKVKTHYHGTLINGEIFDSSVDRGEPITFPVNGVIQGWVEALQLMPAGSKFKLFVPQNLAYGVRGGGQAIKPYSALIFEVELLEIEK
jgi:FKBP-type peptidyl-prolyl cis-trans isomerase FklB